MNNPEEDARNALLAHYSAKSTAQTAVLVGLAVVFFGSVQAYDVLRELKLPFELDNAFLVFSIITIAFFGVRAIGRLVYYGELATAILSVKMPSFDETKRRLEKDPKKPRLVNYEAAYLVRLAYATGDYLGGRKELSLHVRMLFAISNSRFKYVYIIPLFVLALFVFHLWLLSWIFSYF